MTPLTFQRSSLSPLYFATGPDNQPDKTLAYLLPTDNQSDPPSLTLDQSWPKFDWQPFAGSYLILNTTDYDEAKFAAAARVFLWGGTLRDVRFSWFLNPQDASNNRPLNALVINATPVDPQTYKVKEVSFTLSPNFTLFFAGGCQITLDGANNQFQIAQLQGRTDSIAIKSVFGTQKTFAQGSAYLPMTGTQRGCLQFQFGVTNQTLDENHLDVCLRYYMDDPDSPGNIISKRYPIFNPEDTQNPITAWASLFLLDVFDVTRTYFSFNGQNGTAAIPTSLPTYFRTNTGNKVALTPQSNALAGFVFSVNSSATDGAPGDPYYNVPTGAFGIGVEQNATTGAQLSTAPAYRVMCGISGAEYVGLMNATNNVMNFVPNQNAYAPNYAPPDEGVKALAKAGEQALVAADASAPLLAKGAQTSWIYIAPADANDALGETAASVQYFAQPDDSIMFEAAVGQPIVLDFMEVPAGVFPANTVSATKSPGAPLQPNCYPMVPYAGVQSDTFDDFQAFELQILSPTRRNTIYSFLQQPQQPAPGTRTGTTPQGLLSTFDSSLTDWQTLTLGQSSFYELTDASLQQLQSQISPPAFQAIQALRDIAYPNLDNYQAALQARLSASDFTQYLSLLLQSGLQQRQLQLTSVQGALKEALQTNQLFLVITDPEKLLSTCSFNYFQLTAQALLWIKTQNPALETLIAPLQDNFYNSAVDYTTALLTKISQSELDTNHTLLFQAAAFGEIVIQGWTFNLSPNTWNSWSNGNTMLILKYSGKSVIELASDKRLWTSADDFNQASAPTQQELLAILNDGIKRARNHEAEFFDFAEMVTDPHWNGVLALQCFLPLAEMPPQLQGIAAGINPALFYAHHVGININPIQHDSQNLAIQDSSLFGLIYYDDSTDLTYNQTDYQFKVLTLKVLFKNSAIVSFASQIELYINKFFGEPAVQQNSQHGNNLLLNGVYQKQGDTESYVFSEQGSNRYKMTSQVLSDVEIVKAQFNTVVQPGGIAVGQQAQADFILWGNLRFVQQPAFDLFSFGNDAQGNDGHLSFSNLLIHMTFVPDPPEGQTAPPPTFTFDAGQLAFDLAKSSARSTSLYNHFPLKLTGFLQAKEATTPTDLGYMAVDSPLNSSALTYPWYGLQFELNMGGPGALAAKVDFTATLLAAWAPAKNLSMFLGIKLPGFSGASKEFTLESVVKLAISNIEFIVSGQSGYMMKFDNLALKFFMVKFPPSGQTNIYLFGDPNNQDNTTLGWYAVYAKAKKSAGDKQQTPKALPPA